MQLPACNGVTTPVMLANEIPDSLLSVREPVLVADPSAASQADAAKAYVNLYDAWEACAADKEAIAELLSEQKKAVKLLP